jgi:transcription initiation factor TFIID subunit 1
MDVDPNYDPSDFLMSGLPMHSNKDEIKIDEHVLQPQDTELKIHDDLAVSESEDEGQNVNDVPVQEEDDGGDLWF